MGSVPFPVSGLGVGSVPVPVPGLGVGSVPVPGLGVGSDSVPVPGLGVGSDPDPGSEAVGLEPESVGLLVGSVSVPGSEAVGLEPELGVGVSEEDWEGVGGVSVGSSVGASVADVALVWGVGGASVGFVG